VDSSTSVALHFGNVRPGLDTARRAIVLALEGARSKAMGFANLLAHRSVNESCQTQWFGDCLAAAVSSNF